MKKFIYSKTTLIYLAVVLVATIMLATAYVALQQTIRQMANEPQVETCQNLMETLDGGTSPTSLNYSTNAADIRSTLSTFFIIYAKNTTPVASSVVLDGATTQLPSGVLAYADKHGEDRITWQPDVNTRIAAVVKSGQKYNVLCGRSLKESEKLQDLVFKLFAFGWFVTMLAITAVTLFIYRFTVAKKSTK